MKNKFYITTSIAYVNSPPHIGFALELAQADVLARWRRLKGDDVFFLTGADEHGAKIAKAAASQKKTPKQLVDENAEKFIELTKILNISNNDFIRTSDQNRHWPSVRKLWQKLEETGDIYKAKYKGLYCVGCEAFITEKDLKDGKCVYHQAEPQEIEEDNYFFRLSKYSKKIGELIKKDKIKIIPEARKNEILNLIEKGLQDVSISRPSKDIPWGVPVSGDGKATVYVWFEALINYISAIGYKDNGKNFKKWWPADIHCIGKDILRFHAAIWPGMLLATRLELPKKIFVHGHILSGGQKMSKSLGNVIDPFEMIEKYGPDALRYYLLREITPTDDGDFTIEKFKERYNGDLASGLGNLTARIVTLGMRIPIRILSELNANKQFQKKIRDTWQKYEKNLGEIKFNDALAEIWDLISYCDKYINDTKPWQEKDSKKFAAVLGNLLITLANIAHLLKPFMPQTSDKIFEQLGIGVEDKKWKFKPSKKEALFPRIVS